MLRILLGIFILAAISQGLASELSEASTTISASTETNQQPHSPNSSLDCECDEDEKEFEDDYLDHGNRSAQNLWTSGFEMNDTSNYKSPFLDRHLRPPRS